MRKWILIFVAVFMGPTWAASTVTTKNRIGIYLRPEDGAGVVFSVPAGQSLTLSDRSKNGFRKVRTMIDGRPRTGYVLISDLNAPRDMSPTGTWSVGGGLLISRYSQAAKTFSTKDQVNYTTSSYTGQSVAPSLTMQFGSRDFWRLGVHYRKVELTGTATTDVPGSTSQAVKLTYTMAGGVLEAAWALWGTSFYLGGGVGYDRTLSGSAFLGSQDLTSAIDMPSFLSAHALAGYHWQISPKLAAFLEGRGGAVTNQSPVLIVIEATAQVMYWP